MEQYEVGYRKIFGAVFNLPTSEARASKADGDAQAVANTEVKVG